MYREGAAAKKIDDEADRIVGQVLEENGNSELNSLLKRFWVLETLGIVPTEPRMKPEDKVAFDKVHQSFTFNGKHYEVAVPWRDERLQLPHKLPMAKKRLLSTDRKLLKEKEVAVAYTKVRIVSV